MTLSLGTADLTLTATNQPLLTAVTPLTVMKGIVCNTDSSNRTVTIYKVPAGATSGAVKAIVDGTGSSAFTLRPGETLPLPLSGLVLGAGDSLQGLASVTSVVQFSVGYVVPS